jgi:hypothetical protein
MAATRLHNPTAPEPAEAVGAEALRSIREARIGVLENSKQHAELALTTIVEELGKQHGAVLSMVGHKSAAAPAKPELLEELAESSDMVLIGSAD